MHPRSALRGAVGFLFPLAVLSSILALLASLVGEEIRTGFVVVAVAVVLLGAVTAAALTAVAVVRRQWGWAAALLVVWPVVVPFYLRHLRRRREREGSREPEV